MEDAPPARVAAQVPAASQTPPVSGAAQVPAAAAQAPAAQPAKTAEQHPLFTPRTASPFADKLRQALGPLEQESKQQDLIEQEKAN
jgi:hypothetical protein